MWKNSFFAKKCLKYFGGFGKNQYLCTRIWRNASGKEHENAEIAQLVEHNLAKVGVASSSLVFRSHLE